MTFDRTIESARAKDHATGKSLLVSRRTILGLPLLAAPALLTGCTAETLLSAGFNQDTASQLAGLLVGGATRRTWRRRS
ncbi:hypothetical protein WME73_10395 [Sorangium sp. So ce302]|uniref:hypothetical protein n=1 Tax=Sorangium sp. So ce302 TaxID=3133297 RepID=UPI003F5FC0BD